MTLETHIPKDICGVKRQMLQKLAYIWHHAVVICTYSGICPTIDHMLSDYLRYSLLRAYARLSGAAEKQKNHYLKADYEIQIRNSPSPIFTG